MYELEVTVTKVLGTCTASQPTRPGDSFTVRNGDIRIPKGGHICMWALQNLIPVITPKEREILEETDQDWMWRVQHVQCPDPEGRVIFKIDQVGPVKESNDSAEPPPVEHPDPSLERAGGDLQDLRVVVETVKGKCTSGMQPGDYFLLHSGRLYIPAHRHFCLYALHAALPLLPAKQRPLPEGDWLREDCHVICPDPAGNVIMRIEPITKS